ncbi:MAG: L-glutamate gamma-semialdehyde dehydrogenase [Actinobacteria bacterium]|nr:L-glutamate gamma-semialdehyde dehydrogenase [Actinomycetota bacterium]
MDTVPSLEDRIQTTARTIFAAMADEKPGRFSRERLQGDVMEWAMADERLKVEMLRFIDVFPTLRSRDEIARHLREYFAREGIEAPTALRWGVSLAGQRSPLAPLASAVIRGQMKSFARRFIAGRDARDAVPALRALRRDGVGFTLDVLGEATVSEAEGLAYQRTYLGLLDDLAAEAATWPVVPVIDEAAWGPLPRVNLSLKITALYSQIDPLDFDGSVAAVKERLRPIFRRAMETGAALTLDLEQFRSRDLTLAVFMSLLDEEEFLTYDAAGLVLQAYLRDADHDLDRLVAWARERDRPFHLRLVKGAYWDYETVIAAQEGWPVPVFTFKADTDAMYERLARSMLEASDVIRPAFASHNVRSLAAAIEAAGDLGVARDAFELQMLHGMGDPIKAAVRGLGLRVREYVPVGELIPGMAYLVRRLLENTANDSFLRRTFVEGAAVDELVRPPQTSPDFGVAPRRLPAVEPTGGAAPGPFRNRPHADFSREENREAYAATLARERARSGAHYPLRIGGRDIETTRTLDSVNPAAPDEVVGTVAYGGRAEAEAAVSAARAAVPAWRDAAPAERAAVLFRAAELMRAETMELAALMTLEAGKPWREAGADVDEAVDFLEYYGREMLRLGTPRRMGDAPGEHNLYLYQPRGVALVIAPWNFPLAILTGMTAAALVAGNPVIVKPAGPTPVIAGRMVRILEAAGAPAGTVTYLPCPGGEVGDFLVRHPDVDLIAFTGSLDVGLRIISQAAQHPARDGIKKVIAEMGGKNAIIVDSDADLDLAVSEVVVSAFSYAGQKCSAASRVIVLEAAHDEFVHRLVEATRSLRVGPPEDPATRVPPVITGEARERIQGYIAQGMQEATLAAAGEPPEGGRTGGGFYVAPHVFTDVPPSAVIAQEEIFGPVVGVMKAADMDEALAIANGVKYALTGGLISRSPATIARVRREFRVGNLYINRGITGALVERQPFGGFKMSGVGSKAGGPDYLLQFLEPRVITENTLRRGFAPPDELLEHGG